MWACVHAHARTHAFFILHLSGFSLNLRRDLPWRCFGWRDRRRLLAFWSGGAGARGLREPWVREGRAAPSLKLQMGLSRGRIGLMGWQGSWGSLRNLERIICQGSVWILEGWLGPSLVVCVTGPALLAGLPWQAAWQAELQGLELGRSSQKPLEAPGLSTLGQCA